MIRFDNTCFFILEDFCVLEDTYMEEGEEVELWWAGCQSSSLTNSGWKARRDITLI